MRIRQTIKSGNDSIWLRTLLCVITILAIQGLDAQPCATIVKPSPSEELSQKLDDAKASYIADSSNADNIIWYGRRLGYTGAYMEAIAVFSRGIQLHPADARMYRHRGHRYITVRCLDKAIADFEKAATIVKNKPDEVEPDGMPNARNIPTSTLQTNIFYHLGLTYFLKKEMKSAEKAFRQCFELSENDDMKVATANWLNIILLSQNKKAVADALWQLLPPGPDLIENKDYWELLRLYHVVRPRNDAEMDEYISGLSAERSSLSSATLNFGLGYYCYLNDMKEKARQFFQKTIASGQWSGFGYIAAETFLK